MNYCINLTQKLHDAVPTRQPKIGRSYCF